MDTTTIQDPAALAERMLADYTTTAEMLAMHVGAELGLWAALAEGPATPSELSRRAPVHVRYAREWLEQMAVAGLLECTDVSADAEARSYVLPEAAAMVLADPSSEAYMGPMLRMIGGVAAVVREVVEAFRTGGGVPFEAYGREVRHGLAEMNGGAYDALLADWIAALPDVERTLRTTSGARVLDVGCGTGRASLAIAREYPDVSVHGIDLDAESIREARDEAAAAGLAHRVSHTHGDAARADLGGPFHLAIILEALHDVGDPVGLLRNIGAHLAPGGVVFVSDQRCPDTFTTDGDVLSRFQYACSTLHCLPATMAADPVHAHGTVLRAPTVDEWARAAGFHGARVLDIDNEFWQMYRIR